MKAQLNPGPFNGKSERPMRIVMSWLGILRRIGQKAGPYLMLEMLLPGGTLLALLLFLYRRGGPDIGGGAKRAIVGAMRTLASISTRNVFWYPYPLD
jgi:hypothetical protein